MNIDYLCEFVELAKRQNITKTAQVLNMLQPTLSKHISILERELGVELFDRSGRTLSLSPEGNALLDSAYKVIDSYNVLKQKAHDLKKIPPSHLLVRGLTNESPSTEVLGFLLSILGSRYGSDAIEIDELQHHNATRMLENGEADIIFDSAYDESEAKRAGISAVPVGDLPFVAIVSRDNPLAESNRLPIASFRESEILNCEGIYISRSWPYVKAACEHHGFKPNIRSIHCGQTSDLIALCANLGESVLFAGSYFANRLPSSIASRCSIISLEDDDATIPFYFLYSKDNQNPMLRYLIDQIREMPYPLISF